MPKGRLEAFSDGVIAIIITIMVLEIATPAGPRPADLAPLWTSFFSYALSFFSVGACWNNHHHLLNLVDKVSGRMLWANLFFLFVLSFVPVATDWIDKTSFAAFPTMVYILLNIVVSLAYMLLETVVRRSHRTVANGIKAELDEMTPRQAALIKRRSTFKERWTIGFELAALVLALAMPGTRLAYAALILAYGPWIIPDLRIVHVLDWLAEEEESAEVSQSDE